MANNELKTDSLLEKTSLINIYSPIYVIFFKIDRSKFYNNNLV